MISLHRSTNLYSQT